MIRGALRENLQGGRLKGGIFRSHLQWVKEHGTPEQIAAMWARLDPEIARQLSGPILATSFYPFEWLIAFDRSIAGQFGGGNLDVITDLGRYSARINLSTTYKVLDRDTNHGFFRNAAILHSQFQDFGSASYEETGPSSGRMKHAGYSCFSPVYCASAIGYYEGCLTSHGAKTARVEETSCQCRGETSCTFEMNWS